MAEQPSRKRRIVRRTVTLIAIVVLLPVWYVSSYLGFMWLLGHGSIPKPTAIFLSNTVFAPIRGYYAQQLPGWKHLSIAEMHVYWIGRGEPLPERERRMINDLLQE